MMLDDVIGSDRDEFPLEQVQSLLGRLALDEDWDAPGEPLSSNSQRIAPEEPMLEPISG
jgi:hypothetical protein